MRKVLIASFLALFLISPAQSDQALVEEIEFAGGMLTSQQQRDLSAITCNAAGCQSLITKVGEMIGNYSDDDLMIEAILVGATNAYPAFAIDFSEAGMMEAPYAIDTIASVMMETAPTAAGGCPPQ